VKPFKFEQATTAVQASQTHADAAPNARFISGGTDILGEIKESVLEVNILVSLAGLSGASGIISSDLGLEIGALVTLARIASDQSIVETYPALAQAAESVATPQIRNVGTLGGNLCQRPRCWYYRSPLFDCLKKGGETCFASDEGNKYHAILGAENCHIVHPSDVAVALLALDATVVVSNASGDRQMPIGDFFVSPDVNMLAENVLEPGEFVPKVKIPKPSSGTRSVYLKAKERQAYDFALSSVAVSLEVRDETITQAHVALGGVAPVPYSVPQVDSELTGQKIREVDVQAIGQLAVKDAQPLSDNSYKVRLTASMVARAVSRLISE
jgi:xanthine dehydrogenase YagS FAD-binding subunit